MQISQKLFKNPIIIPQNSTCLFHPSTCITRLTLKFILIHSNEITYGSQSQSQVRNCLMLSDFKIPRQQPCTFLKNEYWCYSTNPRAPEVHSLSTSIQHSFNCSESHWKHHICNYHNKYQLGCETKKKSSGCKEIIKFNNMIKEFWFTWSSFRVQPYDNSSNINRINICKAKRIGCDKENEGNSIKWHK